MFNILILHMIFFFFFTKASHKTEIVNCVDANGNSVQIHGLNFNI